MIIYPPFIADTIPAFTTDKIVIPFSQNPAVSIEEVSNFKLIIQDYLSSNIIAFSTAAANNTHLIYNADTKSGEVIFTDFIDNTTKEKWAPTAKQYYKFQMSYSDDGAYNAYSTASIGRCIGNGGDISIIDLNKNIYTGMYITDISSEPIYSYRFTFKNIITNEVLQDTGNILHNVKNDIIDNGIRISQHEFKVRQDLKFGEYYKLRYSITTINGFTISTVPYTIVKPEELPMIFKGNLKVQQNTKAKDNGYIEISLFSDNNKSVKGDFILERSSDGIEWTELTKFHLTQNSDLSQFTWKDWSVEQGVEYVYGIRQYSGAVLSERVCSNSIMAEFEHMFLSDGKKQLKIKYNPKISSFKDIILEQKTDTIGSKYPFFFRNNQVRYKEIPISGLISYWMDEDNFFMTDNELKITKSSSIRQSTASDNIDFDSIKMRTTQLTDYNYTAERKFKLSVLEWLTNGEPKLFRSPAEGNYVVRLMNTSLSPDDTLGRMLHTFSSTGYEIMNNTIDNLKNYKLIDLPELKDPEPQKILKTLGIDWIGNEESKTFVGNDIENITWISLEPNATNTINIDGENYVNTTGIFSAPSGSSITITKEILLRGDTIVFYYKPEIDPGIDEFSEMIENSENVLFSIPAGYTIQYYPSNITGDTLDCLDQYNNIVASIKIYNIYTVIVSKDVNNVSSVPEDYRCTIGDSIIDCSDGQLRYYYNQIISKKGKALHLDIYARIEIPNESSKLSQFILNKSKLG